MCSIFADSNHPNSIIVLPRHLALCEAMDRLDFPQNAKTCFLGVETRLLRDAEYLSAFEKGVGDYMADPNAKLGDALSLMNPLFREHHENAYTMEFMFNFYCGLLLHDVYRKKGLADSVYWEGMMDFKAKLTECIKCKNVPGTFVGSWFDGFFKLRRFALGRFQYEPHSVFLDPDRTLPCGYVMKQNSQFVGFHIPATGVPLSDEVRNESYRLAYEFFKDQFGGGPVILRTCTWLLYPRHYDFLPKHSNILRFMDDFQLDNWWEKDTFRDAWRVFDGYADLPLEEWPEDTSLRRAYKQWLLAGNKSGEGAGLIVVDKGINVTKIKGYFG